ncbi:unnamed protein product [Rhizophagus irregularis]|nr:unnamed protein product [Rhizophagus irregularis]
MSSSTNVDIDFSSTSYELLEPYPQLDVVSNIGKKLPSTIPVVTSMLSSSPSLRSQHHGNIFTYSFHTCKLNPYVVRDTRGSGTLYNTKKRQIFPYRARSKCRSSIDKENSFNIYTNDIDMTNDHHRIFNSTSKKVNVNFLIGTYLTFIFAINRQFSPDIVKNLLKIEPLKLLSVLVPGLTVIYLGFYFRCDLNCTQPAAVVLSQNRWKCHKHLGTILGTPLEKQKRNYNIPGNPMFRVSYASQNPWKKIHSTRLGITYDVIVRRYNEWRGKKDDYLRNVMEPTTIKTKKGVETTRLFYKEYRGLQFDDNRTQSQLNRWCRLVNSIVNSERYLYRPKPFLISKDSTVFKKIQHAVERGFVRQESYEDKVSHLPPDFTGNVRAFYYQTYNINLSAYKVRRRFDVSHLPEFKYSYNKAKRLYNKYQKRKRKNLISRAEAEQSPPHIEEKPLEVYNINRKGRPRAEPLPIPNSWFNFANTRIIPNSVLNEEINLPNRNTPPLENSKLIDDQSPRPIARPRTKRKKLPPTPGPDL